VKKHIAGHYQADTAGLLKRYPVTATDFHLIGKETERGWEQSEDISTLLPSLVRYGQNHGTPGENLRRRLGTMSLRDLERATGLSRHTILRGRAGKDVHPRSLRLMRAAVAAVHLNIHKVATNEW
jgi:hypothetical protein